MTDKEFNDFIDTIGTSKEFIGVKYAGSLSDDNKNKIVQFIKENNIDCRNLWKESDHKDFKAHKNWEKLFDFIVNLIPDEENNKEY